MKHLALSLLCLAVGCGPVGNGGSGGSGPSVNSGGSGGGGVGGYGGGTGGSGASGTGGSGGGIDNTPDALTCGTADFMLQRQPPDVMIVLDKSGSMMDPPSTGGASKWSQVTGAINSTVSTLTQIRWGLEFFPTDIACGAGTVAVPVGANTSSMIQTAIGGQSPGGGTPTTSAVNAAASSLSGNGDTNPKFILLATDGQPNCGSGGLGGGDDSPAAEMAVSTAAMMGIHTFVIGVSTDATTDTTLNTMAMNGGEPRAGGPPYYYPVSNQQDLVNAMMTIAGQIVSCTFPLTMRPPDPNQVRITAGGQIVPRDMTHMNGWDYGAGDMSITFYGMWCNQLQSGAVADVHAIFGCPPIP